MFNIDELNALKEIISGLSSAGIYGFVAYVGYQLIKLLAILFVAWKVICKGFDLIKSICLAPVSKDEYNVLLNSARDSDDRLNRDLAKSKAECERVKHMYKILKEAKEGADNESV